MPRVNALNNYLRTHRKRKGFTQRELAHLLGCTHRSKVSRYELGIRIPTLLTVIGLEIVFNAALAELFAGIYVSVRGEIRARARHLSQQIDAKPLTPAAKQKLEALSAIIHPPKERRSA